MKRLKYQSEIDKFQPDLTDFFEQDRIAFRFLFDDDKNPNNYLPVYLLETNRPRDKFEGWGLSFFSSQENAKKRYVHLTNYRKNIYKKIGNNIGEGRLTNDDGISNKSNSYGHFCHLEYENTDLKGRFLIIEKLHAIS